MIRVNLLPQKKRQERSRMAVAPSTGSTRWLLIPLALVVLEVIGLIFFQINKKAEFEAAQKKNNELQGRIADIQGLVGKHDAVTKAIAELTAKKDANDKLLMGRSGPTAALLELAQVLTSGKGPSIDPEKLKALQKKNPQETFNAAWDSRRLWLQSYKEQSRTVKLEGVAKDSQDVSEFAMRLRLSSYFYDVRLLPGKKDDKDDLVSFGITMKVVY